MIRVLGGVKFRPAALSEGEEQGAFFWWCGVSRTIKPSLKFYEAKA